ncbi:MAG: UMP kinase [Candidatus Baldrarchaeia archaeon]
MKRVVIKIGGSIIFRSDGTLNDDLMRKYAIVIRDLLKDDILPSIVTGGGIMSKKYVKWAKNFGANDALCDMLGITLSRANALLLISALGDIAYPTVPTSLEEALKAIASGKVVVMGGLQPGQSTNAVAALLAESIGAEMLIIATDVDGIYSAPPEMSDAKLLKRISPGGLLSLILKHSSFEAGKYQLFDPLAVLIIQRAGIVVRVINGIDPENVVRVLRGEDIGTLVLPEDKRYGAGGGI